MTQHSTTAAVLATLLLVGAALAGATGGVAAQSGDDPDGLFQANFTDEMGAIEQARAMVSGLVPDFSAANYIADLRDEEPDASTQANRLQTYLNEHNQSFRTHTNDVLRKYNESVEVYNATYVLELHVANDPGTEKGENVTKYFVGHANGTAVTSYTVVNNTTHAVDRTETLDSFAAKSLNADVRDYHEQYVQTGEIPPKSYYVRLASTYGSVSEIAVKRVSNSSWL